jgi:hypothetical protein
LRTILNRNDAGEQGKRQIEGLESVASGEFAPDSVGNDENKKKTGCGDVSAG